MSKITPKGLTSSLNEKLGEESALLLGAGENRVVESLSTGHAVLDNWVIGCGGIPEGRIVEIYGDSSAGKSSLVHKIIAAFQKQGGIAILADTENSYDPAWATLHGVDTPTLVLTQPNYLDGDDGFLAQVEHIISKSTETPTLIVLDSVAALPTKKEFEGGIGGPEGIAAMPRAWSNGLCRIAGKLGKSKARLVLVNQVRSKIVMFGDPTTTPGGHAPKFYSSVRLMVSHGKTTPTGDGKFVKVKATKNKLSPPFRSCELRLDFDSGFNEKWAIMTHAKEVGAVGNKCRKISEALECLHWTSKTLDWAAASKEDEEEVETKGEQDS